MTNHTSHNPAAPKSRPESSTPQSPNFLRRRILALGAVVLTAVTVGEGLHLLHERNELKPINTTTEPYKVVEATEGDTLYNIAERAEPGHDPRKLADQIALTIEKRDGVSREDAETVMPGEEIPLPDDSAIGTEVIPLPGGPR